MGFPGSQGSTELFEARGGDLAQMPMNLAPNVSPSLLPDGQAQDGQGVGIVVGQKGNGHHFVKLVIPGQPAALQGLIEGDILLEINGAKLEGRSVAAVSQLLRGPAGSSFLLRVSRAGAQAPLSYTVSNGVSDSSTASSVRNILRGYDAKAADAASSTPVLRPALGGRTPSTPVERNGSMVSGNGVTMTRTQANYVAEQNVVTGLDSFEQDLEYLDPAPTLIDLQRDDMPVSFYGNNQHGASVNGSNQGQQSSLSYLASDPPADRRPGTSTHPSVLLPSPPPRAQQPERDGEQQQTRSPDGPRFKAKPVMPLRLAPLPRENGAQEMQLQEREMAIQALQMQMRDRERVIADRERSMNELKQELVLQSNLAQEMLEAKDLRISRLEASLREKDRVASQHESEVQRREVELQVLKDKQVQKDMSNEAQLHRDLARAQEEMQQMLAQQQAERERDRDERDRHRNEAQLLREENERLKRDAAGALTRSARGLASRAAPALGNQVVIDNHIILAGITDPATYSSPAARRTRSNPGVGHEQSPSDCPSKNSELRLNPELKSNTDWRGALSVPRESRVYSMARTVIERAAEMMDELDMTQDLADSSWNVTGHALLQLLDTDNNQTAVQRFEGIAGACESVMRSQPVLIEVVANRICLCDIVK